MPAVARRLAPLLFAALAPMSVPAAAQPAPLAVELNKLEADGDGCRATMVVTNAPDAPLASLKLDLVFFDGEGIVARRLAAELAPLAAGKTVVKAFPVAGLGCADISRVLVNDVIACAGPSGPVDGCVDRLQPTSRAAAALTK